MFKWIGLIVGGGVAAYYFALLPHESVEYVPSIEVVAEHIEQVTVGDIVTTFESSIEQGQEVVNDVLGQLNEQSDSLDVNEQTIVGEPSVTQDLFEEETVRQLTFWPPFSNRYSAQGMAESLTQSSGVLIEVINRGNEYLLSVAYGSEAERQLLISKINISLGSEVLK